MPAKTLRPIDVFEALTPKEKREVLAMLKKAEQSPCESRGHSYKPVRQISTGLFSPLLTQMVCTKCGDTFTV